MNDIEKTLSAINSAFMIYYDSLELSDEFKKSIIENFYHHFTKNDMVEFMEIACEKTDNARCALKYFCGICWRKIKGSDLEKSLFVAAKTNPQKPSRRMH